MTPEEELRIRAEARALFQTTTPPADRQPDPEQLPNYLAFYTEGYVQGYAQADRTARSETVLQDTLRPPRSQATAPGPRQEIRTQEGDAHSPAPEEYQP